MGLFDFAGDVLFGSGPKIPNPDAIKLSKSFDSPNAGTGQGGNWLASLGFGGKSLTDQGKALDVKGGGLFDFRGPELAASLLQSEFQPGGTLSDANRSVETARGVNALTSTGTATRRSFIETAVARGIRPERAALMLRDWDQGMLDKVHAYMLEQDAAVRQKRYDALQAWVNMATQTAQAAKMTRANWEIAKFGAETQQFGSKVAGISNIIGGAAGAAGA